MRKLQTVQELQPHDYINGVRLCIELNALFAEKHCARLGLHARQGKLPSLWLCKQSKLLRDRRLHSEQVVVWCIMCVCVYPAHPGKSGLIHLWTPIITTQLPCTQNARHVSVRDFFVPALMLSIKNDPEPMYFQQR